MKFRAPFRYGAFGISLRVSSAVSSDSVLIFVTVFVQAFRRSAIAKTNRVRIELGRPRYNVSPPSLLLARSPSARPGVVAAWLEPGWRSQV